MYYGLEQPVEAPKVAIWDMQPMMQYISLLKDRYDKAQEKMDKFAEKWGDFTTLLQNDNAYVYNNTVGAIANRLNEMQTSGIDPYRSAEGRGMIEALIRSANTQQLKNIKASAPIYQEFMKNKAKMEAEGRYDEELVKMQLDQFLPQNLKGKVRPEDWDTATMGVFPLSSPIERKTLHELTSDLYKQYAPQQKLRAGDATPEDRARLGKYAKFYDIVGVAPEGRKNALDASVTQLDNTIYGRYFQEQARRQAKVMQQNGINITPEQRYAQMIEEANDSHLQPKDVKNDIALRVWEEGQQNWRAQLAQQGRDDKNRSHEYSPIYESTANNIRKLVGNNPVHVVKYKQIIGSDGRPAKSIESGAATYQRKNINKMVKDKNKSSAWFMETNKGSYDGAKIVDLLGRQAANSDKNSVYIQHGDLSRLYTGRDILRNAYGSAAPEGYRDSEILRQKLAKMLENKPTKKIYKSTSNGEKVYDVQQIDIRMDFSDDLHNVEDKNEVWRSYQAVYIPSLKRTMYYDLEYSYSDEDVQNAQNNGTLQSSMIENIGTRQAEIRAGQNKK